VIDILLTWGHEERNMLPDNINVELFLGIYSAILSTTIAIWGFRFERKKLKRRLKVRFTLSNYKEEKGSWAISIVRDPIKKVHDELNITLTNIGYNIVNVSEPPMLKYKPRKNIFSKRLLSKKYTTTYLYFDIKYPITISPTEVVELSSVNPNIPIEHIPFRIIIKDSLGRKYKSGLFYKNISK